jgi:hypothetical protein
MINLQVAVQPDPDKQQRITMVFEFLMVIV